MVKRVFPLWLKRLAYGVCIVNTLLLLLFSVDYLFCEIDLFLILWMSSMVMIVTIPLGVACFVYSLFRLRQHPGRVIALWTLLLLLLAFIVLMVLPSGSSRVPAKMEKHCIKHEAAMLSLANSLYATMPDSTMLEVTRTGGISLLRIQSTNNFFSYPLPVDSDTLNVSASALNIPSDMPDIMKTIHCKELTVYKPTGLATFDYLTMGFGSYWFEVSIIPYTNKARQQQLNTYNVIPYSSHTCFRFHGGATDGDSPFPYKEEYLRRHPVTTNP